MEKKVLLGDVMAGGRVDRPADAGGEWEPVALRKRYQECWLHRDLSWNLKIHDPASYDEVLSGNAKIRDVNVAQQGRPKDSDYCSTSLMRTAVTVCLISARLQNYAFISLCPRMTSKFNERLRVRFSLGDNLVSPANNTHSCSNYARAQFT
ncbi:hypothetical protein QAD02_001830 [Eretmocerus hayati]|uniref:Uncharacterized protein n=1 Tax=Eretmocerus hayati TaxID=131215 RepID=A0ACC2NIX5_9HYME|nr:hypothetical protein QAD02_001830 [Eretmocerus hayati]